MIGIGIDTGGTYTDAAVYDLNDKKVLASAKSLTTKYDLKIGITNALEMLPIEQLSSCSSLALSTTLATNACVEGIGGKGKLILIGTKQYILEESYTKYGIDSLDDVFVFECEVTDIPETCEEPDWNDFEKRIMPFVEDCDCVSIVQLFAREHHGSFELKAKDIVEKLNPIPVILGHDLFPDRNIIRRGAGALLNARLIPIINEFLDAVREVFNDHGLAVPMLIVNSSGHLMSTDYTLTHPVETLLCGPAASIMGSQHLTDENEAIVIDMGGTTTDVAIIHEGIPLPASDGVHIGDWKTFVKGLFIDTFSLGGDTAVRFDKYGKLTLGERRHIPLCILATEYPKIKRELEKISEFRSRHTTFLHEFLVLLRDVDLSGSKYSEKEIALLTALKDGPLSLTQAAEVMNTNVPILNTEKFEAEGIIIRAGLTPTDIMHIKGDFTKYDKKASEMAVWFMSGCTSLKPEEICDQVYDMVIKRLFTNLVRILLQYEDPYFNDKLPDENLDKIIESAFNAKKSKMFSARFKTKAKLIAIGAPTHIFLPEVAKMLGTEAIVPKYAEAANAVGAIVGNMSSTVEVDIVPKYKNRRPDYFRVVTKHMSKDFKSFNNAYEYATEMARETAIENVVEQGGKPPFNIHINSAPIDDKIVQMDKFALTSTVSVTVSGKA